MDQLDGLVPGESISCIVRVLEKPGLTAFKEKQIIKAKVGDGTNIANLVAWDKEVAKWDIEKGDIVKITNGNCPKSHRESHQPPTITVGPDTLLEKQDRKFPSIDECVPKGFLNDVPDYRYLVLRGFISRIYRTASYFCLRCKKFSDEMCDCGNFPDPIFRISGMFSDGTKTMPFSTVSEDVAEDISGDRRSNAKKVDVKCIMNRLHKFMGYVRNGRLYVEEVI